MNASIWDSPLGAVADAVAARDPAPAGVAACAVAGTLGVSLLIKVLEIRDQRADIRAAARQVSGELRAAADADCAAIRESLRSDEAIDIPMRAVRSIIRGRELCIEAAPAISGILAADLLAARELLAGAGRAILACIDANLEVQPSAETAAEVVTLRARLTV